MRQGSFFPSNYVLSNFERTNFERKLHLGMNSKEHNFSFETNFERTTDEFRKNVIRTNDLARLKTLKRLIILFHFNRTMLKQNSTLAT